MNDDQDESFSDDLRFSLRLIIKHPADDLGQLTSLLGLEPFTVQKAGCPRKTPNGASLGGNYKSSAWIYTLEVDGNRYFFKDVMSIVEKLEPHANFLLSILKEGGRLELVVNLDGCKNIGDTISPDQLLRLSNIGISLGIEVFPEY